MRLQTFIRAFQFKVAQQNTQAEGKNLPEDQASAGRTRISDARYTEDSLACKPSFLRG